MVGELCFRWTRGTPFGWPWIVVRTLLARAGPEGYEPLQGVSNPSAPSLPRLASPGPPTYLPAMAMIWDSTLVGAVARELNQRLAGARLQGHLFDWEQREISLYFRSETLCWSLHPEAGWVTLQPAGPLPEGARPLSAELIRVETPPDERLLRFLFRKPRGRERSVQIIFELMTNQWNALLVEGQEMWVRHLLWTRRSEGRELATGQGYRPPEPSRRKGVSADLSQEEWTALMAPEDTEARFRTILESVGFTSPLNLPTLLGEGGTTEDPESVAGPSFSLWHRLRSYENQKPCLIETTRGLQAYPYVLNDLTYTEFPTILEALAAASQAGDSTANSSSAMVERLDRALHRTSGRVKGLEREMAQASDPDSMRERANLLLARLGEVEKGVSRVKLKGFLGEEVFLDLDPILSPHENAQALYEEAARQERALKRLPPLLEKARRRMAELSELRDNLLTGNVGPEAVEALLPATQGKERWKGPGQGPRIAYKRYRSSGGLEIRVGRGSKDNDTLTFRHSQPQDIWLHARDAGGAHVILRWTKDETPPAQDLSEAAVLAALHSRSRNAQVVPVDWTRRKHVRKPRKAPPGTVIPDRTRTLFVEPDPELPQRLAWEK